MEAVIEAIGTELAPEEAAAAYNLLIKIFCNILKAQPGTPEAIKVRTLKKESKAITTTLRTPKCFDLLLMCGFEDTGVTFHLVEGGEDREVLENAVELLQALVASVDTQAVASPPVAGVPAPAPASLGGADAKAAPGCSRSGAAANSRIFQRREEGELKREAMQDELSAIRAAQKAQYAEGGAKAPGAVARDAKVAEAAATTAQAAHTAQGGDAAKKQGVKSAFDFESRSKKEAQANAQAQAAQDLRSLQKEKYTAFKADPTAQRSEAYQKPPSVAPGGSEEGGFFSGWFSGWGGSSSSGGGGSGYGGGRNDRPAGPRMKTINDLPKPVQRG